MSDRKIPQIPEETFSQPPLVIPDLSEEFSSDDFLKELVMDIPDLHDLLLEEESRPALADPAAVDLDIGQVPPPPMPQASRTPPAPTTPKKHSPKQTLTVAAAILLLPLLLLGLLSGIRYFTDPYDHRILENVTLGGVDLGGMTRREARSALDAAINVPLSTQDMVITLPHGTITLPAEKTHARLRTRAAVRAAYRIGRVSDGTSLDAADYLRVDADYIRQQLSAYAAIHETSKTQYTHRMLGKQPALEEESYDPTAPCQTLSITLGSPGFGLDMQQITADIFTAYAQGRFQVSVDEIDPSAYPDPVDLEALLAHYTIAPVDSALDMENYTLIPGAYGYTFDLDQAQNIINAANYGETVSIPMEYVTPEITRNQVYFRDILAQYRTYHTTNENRNENLRLACASLDGQILHPGDTLSFNDALGPRTTDRGYKLAPAWIGTEQMDAYGGGIGQVASTLYYCAMLADLEIVTRTNSGFAPSYIDLGMDAAISMGGPDFVFRNDAHFPVQVKAWLENGYVNLQILGTQEKDYYIQLESHTVSQENPGVTYEYHRPGEGYYEGQLLHPGIAALHVQTYRCKYHRETDELLSREPEATSHYLPADKVVVQLTP